MARSYTPSPYYLARDAQNFARQLKGQRGEAFQKATMILMTIVAATTAVQVIQGMLKDKEESRGWDR